MYIKLKKDLPLSRKLVEKYNLKKGTVHAVAREAGNPSEARWYLDLGDEIAVGVYEDCAEVAEKPVVKKEEKPKAEPKPKPKAKKASKPKAKAKKAE